VNGELGLYEPAAFRADILQPLWHVADSRMLFAGCLGRNAPHSHSTSVLLAGLYDDFALKVGTTEWVRCRTAVIRAGTSYEFDASGRPLAVVYVEPNAASVDGLARLIGEAWEIPGAVVGRRGEISLIRALYEDPKSPAWVAAAIEDLVCFMNGGARRKVDERIAHTIDLLAADEARVDEAWTGRHPPVAIAARRAGLSTSRFQHVFKGEIGVSYRRYLGWRRMRMAVRDVVAGSNLTMAAHGAGYCDQAHFAHAFRRIFGAPASRSLARARR
jgi:AraC-like DNA-binding protein